jgi:hypothetical protein
MPEHMEPQDRELAESDGKVLAPDMEQRISKV